MKELIRELRHRPHMESGRGLRLAQGGTIPEWLSEASTKGAGQVCSRGEGFQSKDHGTQDNKTITNTTGLE